MSRQVIVLGNHRTGSSCLAGVLSKLGIPMGYDMLGAHPSNPGGHFEDREFLLVNDAVVGHWDNPRTDFGEVETVELQGTYVPMIQMRNRDFNIWGMKDPRLCILFPVILPLLDDPVILHIVRNYDASIMSLAKREHWSTQKARDVLDVYSAAKAKSLQIAEDVGAPIYTIQFEDLLQSPQDTIVTILCAVFSRWDSGLHPSAFLQRLAAEQVNPEFVHHE